MPLDTQSGEMLRESLSSGLSASTLAMIKLVAYSPQDNVQRSRRTQGLNIDFGVNMNELKITRNAIDTALLQSSTDVQHTSEI